MGLPGTNRPEGVVLKESSRFSVAFAATVIIVSGSSIVGAQEPAASAPQRAQEPSAPATQNDQRQTVGTVSSSGRGSIVVRTDEGRFIVYTVDRRLVGVPRFEPGTRIRITTAADDDDPVPTALAVDRLPAREGLAQQPTDPVPANVQRLTAQIERQARRFRAGVFRGAALDPELISVDAFATLTPWPQPRLAVRPSFELAFGELTTLIGLHLDVLYSLPGIRPSARWAPYVGAGPNFSFSHRGIEEEEFLERGATDDDDDDGRFDFSQYDWNNGFNFIVGARNPNGTFFELKATAYGVANIRMLAGFEF